MRDNNDLESKGVEQKPSIVGDGDPTTESIDGLIDGKLRHVVLEDFQASIAVDPESMDAYRRRYASLFLDEDHMRNGSSGKVYRGHNAWGDDLAVKLIDVEGRDEAGDALDAAIFKREYEAQRLLSGVRGFPTLFGWGRIEGRRAIVMEWLTGETLDHVRDQLAVDDRGALSPRVAAALGRDIFELIARMDLLDEGIVHRDLSLSNVMVATDRRTILEQAREGSFELRIIDFGSAVLPYRAPSLTEMGGAMRGATPDFAAPEMLTEDLPGLPVMRKSSAVDVYAAASIVYQLLSGYPPYDLQASGFAADGAPSYYLKKTQDLPRALEDAHRAATDLQVLIEREEAIDGRALSSLQGLDFEQDDKRIRAALRAVDGQIADVILACLEASQELRPSAAVVRDALSSIVDDYEDNVALALEGGEVASIWHRKDAEQEAKAKKWRIASIAVKVLAAFIFIATLIATCVSCNGVEAAFDLGPISWEGTVNGWALGAAYLVPVVLGYGLRWKHTESGEGLLRGTIGILLGVVCLCIASVMLRFASPAIMDLALWAVALCSSAAWAPMVMDYGKSLMLKDESR